MVHKHAVRKQQDTSRSVAKAAVALHPLAHDPVAPLSAAADAFNAAVTQSVADADSEAVHRVRTTSRRLQAVIEATLREAGPAADVLERPARACLRPIKQIRRAAGAVRDLDVQRKLLETWLAEKLDEKTAEKTFEQPHRSDRSPLRAEAEALEAWLRSERKHLAHGMQKQIRKRQRTLAERQGALIAAMAREPRERTNAPRPADAVALEAFVRAADAMPLLDAENLHDFRKATKKARYVAESGAAAPSHVAKALKQIQDAIGDWHDWLCLSEDAQAAMGQDAAELKAALRHELTHHFAAAMKTTQSVRGRLLGEWMAAAPAKRPPAAVAIDHRRAASGF